MNPVINAFALLKVLQKLYVYIYIYIYIYINIYTYMYIDIYDGAELSQLSSSKDILYETTPCYE